MSRFRCIALSIAAGVLGSIIWAMFLWSGHVAAQWIGYTLVGLLDELRLGLRWHVALQSTLAYALVPLVVGLGVYAALRKHHPPPPPKETRCRRCSYVLNGITKPRCPECGEAI